MTILRLWKLKLGDEEVLKGGVKQGGDCNGSRSCGCCRCQTQAWSIDSPKLLLRGVHHRHYFMRSRPVIPNF
jgi:hypothetical protein